MKKLALALTLVFATGYISNAVYAATSTNYTVFQDGNKKKSNSKKSCHSTSSDTSKKSCSGEASKKSCCSAEKK
ncbi:MAG TPA: hypothetical protein PKN22_03100 [Taishania sp.]|nr:hypothetical protein [Taishania sp.]HNS41722.1 hypothetical protein [Taishania sp.]